MKRNRVLLLIITCVGALFPSVGIFAAVPPKITEYRLLIPALQFDRPVILARATTSSWNFNYIRYTAAYLEGRPLPGSGNNVALGAHSELAKRRPGPFYRLDQLKPGDSVIVKFNGKTFYYEVERLWTTTPDDSSPIAQADSEQLTLFTCSAYNPESSTYELRLIVRAHPVAAPTSL
jgi:LPXTG-site transpeptidase (sortase) family protein